MCNPRPRGAAWVFALCVGAAQPGVAEDLPDPLSLRHALSLADESHPDLARSQAARDRAQAGRLEARSATGLEASVIARGGAIEPSDFAATRGVQEDLLAGIVVRKNLYDFGRTRGAVAAAEAAVQGTEMAYLDVRQRRRLDIMRRYFDVLLADLQYTRDNEEMAVVFVALDRLRDRHELGQESDIDLYERESRFENIRARRIASQHAQRTTRARLANALGRPGELPSNLAVPDLALERDLPELADVERRAHEANPALRALRAQVEASRWRIAAARAGGRPTVGAELEAYHYERELPGREKWRAGVVLEVPLATGGRVDARVAAEQAELARVQAEVNALELQLGQQVLETYLELEYLQARRQEMAARRDFRSLYLDRSRALYELEARADLGDAMVEISAVELAQTEVDFQLAHAWARLDVLTGAMPRPEKEER